jgi:hypothetical protein
MDEKIDFEIRYFLYLRGSHKTEKGEVIKKGEMIEKEEMIKNEVNLRIRNIIIRFDGIKIQDTGVKNAKIYIIGLIIEWRPKVDWISEIDN